MIWRLAQCLQAMSFEFKRMIYGAMCVLLYGFGGM